LQPAAKSCERGKIVAFYRGFSRKIHCPVYSIDLPKRKKEKGKRTTDFTARPSAGTKEIEATESTEDTEKKSITN
jgi:hypothetical protein